MADTTVRLYRAQARRLHRMVRKTKDAGLRARAMVILRYHEGKPTREIAEAVEYDRSAVIKVRRKFLEKGEDGLLDGRRENGTPKVDEDLLEALRILVRGNPQDCGGWERPTWTQELLAKQLAAMTGEDVSESTVGRMLKRIGARWGCARPTLLCPLSKRQKRRRMAPIRALLARCPKGEVVYYEDEVDIHLNPKIGRDWMLRRQQKVVVTPGKNRKNYLAGALNAETGEVVWVEAEKKNSRLFIQLLWRLATRHPRAKKIHLILDNYTIHNSKIVQRALAKELPGRFALHFLPPYSPDDNRIERLWRELHANVTRNHRCKAIETLMENVRAYLAKASPFPSRLARTKEHPARKAA